MANRKMKKWLNLLMVIIILNLIVNLLSLNVLYKIAENKTGLKGELAQFAPPESSLLEDSVIPIEPANYPEGLDTTGLSDEALDCVAENCDSELDCVNWGYDIWDECIENCKETQTRKDWLTAAALYCYSLYGPNATRPLDLVKFNECLAPYVEEFRKALENTPGYTYYETCAFVYCKSIGADAQNNCLRGRAICIAECDEMYPGSSSDEPYDPNDPVPTPSEPKWPWQYGEYASSSYSSSYYSS